ncbi:MAG: hypothetical protein ACI9SJ_001451 [Flavobacteriaceae bacterium]|jgi:hypothetical protein|uniref:hypothetical protein n=1 Tax=Candidatus Marifrigoribacter sp. Uisw_064 TaxID=3230970 RepID=UPI003AEB3D6B
MFLSLLLKLQKNKFILLLLIGSFIPSLKAQNTVSISDYLRAVKDSNQFKLDAKNVSSLNDYHYNSPLLKSVQFRTESRDLLLKRQEYALRIKPNSLEAISRQKKMYTDRISEYEIETQLSFNEDLEKRYLLLIEYIFTDKSIDLFEEKQLQLRDKLTILSKNVYHTNFDVKDLIDAEDELLETNLKLINLKEKKLNQQALINELLNAENESFKIITDDFITAQQIIETNLSDTNSNENLVISLQKLKLNNLENEMKMEVAESKLVLDYVQAKYGGKRSFLFDENFSIGIGINIPFFGEARQKKGDFYYEKLSEESKIALLTQKNSLNRRFAVSSFKLAITNYQTLAKQNEESSVTSLLKNYQSMEGVSPLLLLNLKMLQHKKKIEIYKFEHELYKAYIKFLIGRDVLFQKPLLNYLSTNFEPLNLSD